MTRTHLALAALLLAGASAALAARNDPPARPELFQALLRCRAITDEAARLRCFDAAAANLETAAERREVVMVDRQQVREGRRRLFGLTLPSIPLFGGGDDDEDAAQDPDRVDTLDGVIASASSDGMGRWTVALQDGAVWTQVDDNIIAGRPRPGQPVVIRRAALGSFMMRVNGQAGVRARRVR